MQLNLAAKDKDCRRRNPNQTVLPKRPKRKQQGIRQQQMIDLGAVDETKVAAAAAAAVAEDMPLVTMVTDDGRDRGIFQYEHEIVTMTVTVTVNGIESLFVITGMTAT